MKIEFLPFLLLICSCGDGGADSAHQPHATRSDGGVVATQTEAMQIAEAVAVQVYGRDQIENEKPLIVSEKNGIWYAKGSKDPHVLGGVLEVQISKADGKILRVYHGK